MGANGFLQVGLNAGIILSKIIFSIRAYYLQTVSCIQLEFTLYTRLPEYY